MYTKAISTFGADIPYDPTHPCPGPSDPNLATHYWDSTTGKCMPFVTEVKDGVVVKKKQPSTPSWVMPAMIGGGALLVLLFVMKR
jgi:hypothetical protein